MSQSQITEHAGYLSDGVKLRAYEAALRAVVRPDTTVLDLGAGTGILGLLAARAGARHVYSIDQGNIITTTEAIARASGFADVMTFIQGRSTRVALPEPVDVIVCDQIGGLAYDAGVLDFFADARQRLAGPDSTLVPSAFQLLAAPVEAASWPAAVGLWNERPAGFDMSPMFELAANTEFRVDLEPGELLGPAACWATVPADRTEPIAGTSELVIERPGELNAVAGMFVAVLVPGVELSNDPRSPHRFRRWQNLYPLAQPVPVVPGDQVSVHFDVRPRTYVATWTVTVRSARRPGPVVQRGSTILGMFLTPEDLAASGERAVPRSSPLVEVDRFALGLVDGRRSAGAITDEAWARYPDAYPSRAELGLRVEQLLWLHLRPGGR